MDSDKLRAAISQVVKYIFPVLVLTGIVTEDVGAKAAVAVMALIDSLVGLFFLVYKKGQLAGPAVSALVAIALAYSLLGGSPVEAQEAGTPTPTATATPTPIPTGEINIMIVADDAGPYRFEADGLPDFSLFAGRLKHFEPEVGEYAFRLRDAYTLASIECLANGHRFRRADVDLERRRVEVELRAGETVGCIFKIASAAPTPTATVTPEPTQTPHPTVVVVQQVPVLVDRTVRETVVVQATPQPVASQQPVVVISPPKTGSAGLASGR